jgi:hypothetical protein
MNTRHALALLVASALFAPLARADEDPETLYAQGVRLRSQGQDAQALEAFLRVWQATKSAKSRAQVALAEQALGRWADAEAHLKEALGQEADSWITKNHATLERSLTEVGKHLGTLECSGGVDGTEIRINGKTLSRLPMNQGARLEAGAWTLEAIHAGYYPVRKDVSVSAGEVTRISIEMTPSPAEAGAAPTSAPAPAPPETTLSSTPDRTASSGPPRMWTYVAAGAGVLAAGFGALSLIERNNAATDYNDDASCPRKSAPNLPAACQDKLSSVDTWGTLTTVGFVAGGSLLATSVVLFILGRNEKTHPSTATACGGGPGTAGIACHWTF